MKKYLTVAAASITGVMLTLAATPVIAHQGNDVAYGIPRIYAPPVYIETEPVYTPPRAVDDRYWDRDGNRVPRRHDRWNGMPFTATVTMAPPHGAIVKGIVRLEVRGSGLANVELLPASGYVPRLGVFNVSADRTYAWLDFDTNRLPEGLLHARISAFNVPARQPGASEIIAMPARQWNLR